MTTRISTGGYHRKDNSVTPTHPPPRPLPQQSSPSSTSTSPMASQIHNRRIELERMDAHLGVLFTELMEVKNQVRGMIREVDTQAVAAKVPIRCGLPKPSPSGFRVTPMAPKKPVSVRPARVSDQFKQPLQDKKSEKKPDTLNVVAQKKYWFDSDDEDDVCVVDVNGSDYEISGDEDVAPEIAPKDAKKEVPKEVPKVESCKRPLFLAVDEDEDEEDDGIPLCSAFERRPPHKK